MDSITLDGSGDGTKNYTGLTPGRRYRLQWLYSAAAPSAGTLNVYHVGASTFTVARDEPTGTAQTFDLTATLYGEATVVALEPTLRFTVAGADSGDSVLFQLVPIV